MDAPPVTAVQLPLLPFFTFSTNVALAPAWPLYFSATSLNEGPITLRSSAWHARQPLFFANSGSAAVALETTAVLNRKKRPVTAIRIFMSFILHASSRSNDTCSASARLTLRSTAIFQYVRDAADSRQKKKKKEHTATTKKRTEKYLTRCLPARRRCGGRSHISSPCGSVHALRLTSFLYSIAFLVEVLSTSCTSASA